MQVSTGLDGSSALHKAEEEVLTDSTPFAAVLDPLNGAPLSHRLFEQLPHALVTFRLGSKRDVSPKDEHAR